jgi:hypothetical protein
MISGQLHKVKACKFKLGFFSLLHKKSSACLTPSQNKKKRKKKRKCNECN